MTQADEKELHRLADMLSAIDQKLESASPLREALQKAGIALSVGYIHGLRPKIDLLYQQRGTPLTEAERKRLGAVGVESEE